MIVINRRDHGDDGQDGIRRIQSSAHPGFQNDDLASLFAGSGATPARSRFQRMSDADPSRERVREYSLGRCATSVFADHFTVHLDALAKGDEVRGGEEAGAITCARQMESIIAQTEPLPLVPATWMNALFGRGKIQRAQQSLDVLEAELDPEKLRAEQPRERFAVVHCASWRSKPGAG